MPREKQIVYFTDMTAKLEAERVEAQRQAQTTTSHFFGKSSDEFERYKKIFERAEELAKCKKCERVIYAGNLCSDTECPKRKNNK